jgi:hypothetical protein
MNKLNCDHDDAGTVHVSLESCYIAVFEKRDYWKEKYGAARSGLLVCIAAGLAGV